MGNLQHLCLGQGGLLTHFNQWSTAEVRLRQERLPSCHWDGPFGTLSCYVSSHIMRKHKPSRNCSCPPVHAAEIPVNHQR